ncbi:MAG: hypothetical protein ACERKZ_20505, partial [Lachnotalea sp.]
MDKLATASHQYKVELWTDRIKQCRASGMSVRAWCDYNNVSDKSYYYWLRKIRLDVFEKFSDTKDYSLPIEAKSNSSMVFAPIQLNNTTVIADTAIVLTING